MNTKPYLTLADAKQIGAAAEAEALANGWAVSIAIVDDGGHLLWQQRLDGGQHGRARPPRVEGV
jgi:glc operon protein GlcG